MTPETTLYDAQKKKMQGLCDEHNLTFRFDKDRYPITFTIRPSSCIEDQISMLENVEENGYRSPEAAMTWIFQDGVLTTKVTGGTFTISKTLRQKIENILTKMINFWQQFFFRDIMERGVLRGSSLPQIPEDDGKPPFPEAEPLESFDDDAEVPGLEDDDDE